MTELRVYNATEATTLARCQRERVDAALASGALPAVNVAKRDAARKSWRISSDNLRHWINSGMPTTTDRKPA